MNTYTAEQTVELTTQTREHADGTDHVHYYEPYGHLTSNEGFDTIALSADEAEALNRNPGIGFYR